MLLSHLSNSLIFRLFLLFSPFFLGLICFSVIIFLRWTLRFLIYKLFFFTISIKCYKFHSKDYFSYLPKMHFYTYFLCVFIVYMTLILNYIALCYDSKCGWSWWMFMCTWKFIGSAWLMCFIGVFYVRISWLIVLFSYSNQYWSVYFCQLESSVEIFNCNSKFFSIEVYPLLLHLFWSSDIGYVHI